MGKNYSSEKRNLNKWITLMWVTDVGDKFEIWVTDFE